MNTIILKKKWQLLFNKYLQGAFCGGGGGGGGRY